MNKKHTLVAAAIASISLLAVGIVPAFAQNLGVNADLGVSAAASTSAGSATAQVKLDAKATATANAIAKAEARGDQEIQRRITALNALSAKINAMVNVSASEKTSLSTSIQSQIQALTTLQTQIGVDASSSATSSLKTDIQSITGSYRIFALVLPQGSIAAASDRGMTIVTMLQGIGTKLQARITAAQSAGANVSAWQTTYADFTAKVSDAQANLQAAVSETANLSPDNGNQTIMASNTAALKDARAKIKTANQDFVTARADANTIIKALVSFDASAKVNANATATVQ